MVSSQVPFNLPSLGKVRGSATAKIIPEPVDKLAEDKGTFNLPSLQAGPVPIKAAPPVPIKGAPFRLPSLKSPIDADAMERILEPLGASSTQVIPETELAKVADWYNQNYAAQSEEGGLWAGMGASATVGHLDSAEMYARAGRVSGLDTTAFLSKIKELQAPYEKELSKRRGSVESAVVQGIRSTITSAEVGLPPMLVGLAMRRIPGVGLIAQRISALTGFALSAGTIFGLAEYDRFLEEAEEAGLSRDEVHTSAILSAIAEGGMEVAQDLLIGKVFGLVGPTAKVAKKPLTVAAKRLLAKALTRFTGKVFTVASFEVPGEMLTAATQAKLRQIEEMPTPTPWEAAKSALGPSLVQTILMSFFGTAIGKIRNKPAAYKIAPDTTPGDPKNIFLATKNGNFYEISADSYESAAETFNIKMEDVITKGRMEGLIGKARQLRAREEAAGLAIRERARREKEELPPPTIGDLEDAAVAKEAAPLRAQLAIRLEEEGTLEDVAPGKFLPALQKKLIAEGQTKKEAVKQIKSIAGRYGEAYEDITKGEVFYAVEPPKEIAKEVAKDVKAIITKVTPRITYAGKMEDLYLWNVEEGIAKGDTFATKSLDLAEVKAKTISSIKKFEEAEKVKKGEVALPVSIEKSISLKRAEEITGVKKPTAAQIRDSFDKMTVDEQNLIINNVKNEITELEAERRTLTETRKDTPATDKPLFTQKIKDVNELIEGKKRRLERYQKPPVTKVKEPWEMTREEYIDITEVDPAILPKGWEATPVERRDIEGETYGPGVAFPGTVGWVKSAFKLTTKPSKVAEDELRSKGYTPSKNKLTWTSPLVIDHRLAVRKAFDKGKPIPKEVIAEYPELKKPPITKVKEPWEMTREEYITAKMDKMEADIRAGMKPEEALPPTTTVETSHYAQIKKAFLEGKPVSEKILAEYPELKEAAKKAEPLTHIEKQQAKMDKRYAPLVGTRAKDRLGQEWEFKSTNDLGVPYFVKVVKGKAQKKEFVVSGFDKYWLDEQLPGIQVGNWVYDAAGEEAVVLYIEKDKAYIARDGTAKETRLVSLSDLTSAPPESTQYSVQMVEPVTPARFRDIQRILKEWPKILTKAGASAEDLKYFKVQIVDTIAPDAQENAERSIKAYQKRGITPTPKNIIGRITLRGMHASIELARNVANGFAAMEEALYHEYYHWAREFKIPGNIRAKIDKYYAYDEEVQGNEFRNYIRDTNFYTDAPNWLRQEWLKLKRFLQMLGKWLRGNGFFRPEDVFGQLRVGAFGTRPMTHMAVNRSIPSMAVQQRLLSDLTKEENFKEFFKDSKVRDENGEPLMLFHGTTKPIEIFEHSKSKTIGFHLGTVGQARAKAGFLRFSTTPGASLIPVYANITNPLRMKDVGFGSALGILNSLDISLETRRKLSKQVIGPTPMGKMTRVEKSTWRQRGFEIVRNHIKSMGYDGIVYKNEFEDPDYPGDTYIAFDSTQIKSVFNTGTWSGSSPYISYSAPRTPVPWAFSALTHAVETGIPAGKVPAKVDSLRNWLARVAKPSELIWMGVDGWITENSKEGKVDRKEFLKFLKGNAVELGEVLKTGSAAAIGTSFEEIEPGRVWRMWGLEGDEDIYIDKTGEDKYRVSTEDYADPFLYNTLEDAMYSVLGVGSDIGVRHDVPALNLPGGEDYSELLFTYDPKINAKDFELYVIENFGVDVSDRKAWTPEALKSYMDKYLTQETYTSSHWTEPNVLAHVRFDTRYTPDGRKILFLEEVQSDWLQEAKKDGWEDKPEAPFLHNWHELVMKRMLRHAAENGFDILAWTTGKQQTDRYDLRKYIDKIEYTKRLAGAKILPVPEDAKRVSEEYLWEVKATKGDVIALFRDSLTTPQLEDYFGRDIAQRMIKGEGKSPPITGEPVRARPEMLDKTLSGLDLAIGGEGMIVFYDNLLPGFMKKYVKQWGGKVETMDIITHRRPPTEPPSIKKPIAVPVHSTIITPQMRDSVRYVGQTFFSVKQSQDINDLYRNRGITGPLKDLYQKHIGNPLWNYFSEDLPVNMGKKSEVIDKINKGIITDYRKDPKFLELRDETMFKIAHLKEKAKELSESIHKLSVPEQMRAAQIIRGSITTQSEKYQSAMEIVKHFKRLETDLKSLGILGPDNRFTQLNRKEINQKFLEIDSLDKQIDKLVTRLKPIVQVKINARRVSKDISEKLIVRDAHTAVEPVTRISRWSELNERRVKEALTNRGYAPDEVTQMISRIKNSVEPLAGTTGEVTTIRETLEKTITETVINQVTKMKSFSPAYMAKARGEITRDINKLVKERHAILDRIRLHYHMSGKQYLRRAYKKIEEEKTWMGRIRSYVSKRHRLIRGYDVRRQDLSYEYRQQLEEIKTAPFLAYKGLSEETHDRELMRMFNIIAANKDWYVSAKEWENIQNLRSPKGERLRAKYAKFETMPLNPKKLGLLSGALVDPYIYDDLNQAIEAKSGMMKGYENLLSLWKTGKVVYNPATQARNILSNTILAFFAGLPPWKVQVYAKAASDMLNKSGYYAEAKSTPLLGTEWAGAEVKRFLSDAAALKEGSFLTESHKLIRSILDRPAAAYQGIEQFFKLAVFINERQAGRTIQQAAKHAEGAIFNYQKIPPAIRWAKRFYSPFITFCVSDDTEILTENGWKTFDQLTESEQALTFDKHTSKMNWEELETVHVFPYSGEIYHTEGRSLDILATPEHRNVVKREKHIGGQGDQIRVFSTEIVESKDLKKTDCIVVAGDYQAPVKETIDDDIVRLVGWSVTEGYIIKCRNALYIGQTNKKGQKEVENLRECLGIDKYHFSEHWFKGGTGIHKNYYFPAHRREILLHHYAPNKELTVSFLMKLSKRQLQLLYDIILLADGCDTGAQPVIIQNIGKNADAFQILGIMLGHQPGWSVRKGDKTVAITTTKKQKRQLKRNMPKKKYYQGLVWCPQTPSGTWVARRNGKVFITGNSYKAIPKFAETAIRAPWRVAGLLILLKGMEELARRFLGESEEELEWEKTILPEYMRKALFPGIISHLYLPYKDPYKRSKWLDLSYIMPWGDVAEQWGQSHLVGRPFLPSHPLWVTLGEIMANKVMFTGQDLTIEGVDEGSEYMKKIALHIWRQAVPSLTPGGFSFNKLITALTGEKDWAGRERSFTEAIFDTLLGLKVRSIDYNEQYAWRLRDFRRMISDIKSEFRSDYRKLMMNPTEDADKNQKRFERLYKKTNDKLEKITEKILEIYRGGKE